MNRLKALSFCIAVLSLVPGSPTQGQSTGVLDLLTTIDMPGATGTFAIDINSTGEIVGRYMSGGRTHGFHRAVTGELTAVDFPGSVFTVAAAINDDGDIVGMYRLPPEPSTVRHGYLMRNGEFTTIDPPGSIFTNVLGINERGDIVGRFCPVAPCAVGTGSFHGFTWSNGEFVTVDYPGAPETDLFKITPRGQILGGYLDAGGESHLFLMRDDDVRTVDEPGSPPITLDNAGLNSQGDIVGTYCDASPCVITPTGMHGFLLAGTGEFATIDIPGAVATGAVGINARGDVVGLYIDASGKSHGFLLSAPPESETGSDSIQVRASGERP